MRENPKLSDKLWHILKSTGFLSVYVRRSKKVFCDTYFVENHEFKHHLKNSDFKNITDKFSLL